MDRMNLLFETIKIMNANKKGIDDIKFIGSSDGKYACTWEQFKKLANKMYNSGFGSAKVAIDLTIIFTDGSRMIRHEYDRSEWWEFISEFIMPIHTIEIRNLFTNGRYDRLDEIHANLED
jgi:hypothetical protein